MVHDYQSLVNRLLGKKSPIIDIEYLQLFSNESIKYLFKKYGFANIQTTALRNRYSLSYWLRLLPLPKKIKRMLEKLLRILNIDKLKLAVNVGNIMAVGFKS